MILLACPMLRVCLPLGPLLEVLNKDNRKAKYL